MSTESNTLHPFTDNENQNSILFEDDSDIYELSASDDFLEDLDVSQLQINHDAPLENYEINSADLLSGEDLFGTSVTKISSELNSEWITALSVGTNFDFDLAYSSHELLTLKGNNTVYDTSTNNSLILSRDGLQDISTGPKTTDIFISSDSLANISGDASTVNLYVHEDSLQNVHFDGHFEGIEFNLLLEDSVKIPEVEINGNKLLVKGDTTQEIDFADTEFVLTGININFYSTEGLIDTQNLGPVFNEHEQTSINIGSVPSDTTADRFDQLLFEDDVEIVQISKSQSALASNSDITDITFSGQSNKISGLDYFDENQMSVIVDEANQLLDAHTLYLNPLDIFDDEDFL